MSKHQPLAITVERTIDAPADEVFKVVTDIEQLANLSPECTKAEWLKGATQAEVGAVFKGHNKLGSSKWATKPVVTELESDHVFAFKVPGKSGPTWRYELFPTPDGGTRVVESMNQEKPTGAFIRFLQRRNGVTDRETNLTEGMETTLERLAETVNA